MFGAEIVPFGVCNCNGQRLSVTITRIEDDKLQTEAVSPIDGKRLIGSLSRVK